MAEPAIGTGQQQLGRWPASARQPANRWWPAIRTSPSTRFRAGTRSTCAAGRSTSPGRPTPACPPSCSAAMHHVAWGCTNNICSQRDLYQEKTDPAHPGCFLFDGKWEPQRTARDEVIHVKGGESGAQDDPLLAQRPDRERGAAAAARQARHRVAALARGLQGGWLTALLGHEPRPFRRRVSRGDSAVARARPSASSSPTSRGTSAIQCDGPDSHPQRLGTRLSARLGPGASVARADSLRGHAARWPTRSAAGSPPPTTAPPRRISLSALAGTWGDGQRAAPHPPDDRGGR